MWRSSRPTPDDVRRHLAVQRDLPFSYEAVGATRTDAIPDGFDHDHNRELLGSGAATFAAACAALRAWTMFAPPLVWIEPPGTPIATREVVGGGARAPG